MSMDVTIIEKKQIVRALNLKQDLFCKTFATDKFCYGNAKEAYLKVYGGSELSARSASSRYLDDPRFIERINQYIEQSGFNDVSVDKKHSFLIHQFKDFNVSLKAIEHYNKLKKRVDNTLQIIMPTPLMSLNDDEVIHKIDKSKAVDVGNENKVEQIKDI